MRVKTSDIVVKSGRIRTEFTKIDLLAASIKRFGLLHPPIVTKEGNSLVLIAGERRLRAVEFLKEEYIEVKLKEELSDSDKKIIELEENIQREDLPWTEKVAAISKLYNLEIAENPKKQEGDFPIERVATMLNIAPSAVSDALKLAEAVKAIPIVAQQQNEHKARKLLQTLESAAITAEIMKRFDSKPQEQKLVQNFLNGDCLQLIKQIPDQSIDIVLTDPPFGISIEAISKYGLGSYGRIYAEKDTVEWVFGMLEQLVQEFTRVLKPDAVVFMFFGIQYYQKLVDLFNKYQFNIDEIPAMWVKDQAGQSQRPELWLGSCYEPFLVARKGKKLFLKQGRGNVFSFPKLKAHEKSHPFEKPVELLQNILSLCVLPGDIMLDPFAGTGNSILAAKAEKCGWWGFELDESYWAEGKYRLSMEGGDYA